MKKKPEQAPRAGAGDAPKTQQPPATPAQLTWPIDRFRPYDKNPRKNNHVVPKMEAAIREFGFKIPILARSDGEVVDGHLRLKAALNMGLKELPVILCDEWTPAQVKAFRILVNKSTEWADWDNDALKLEIADLKAMDFNLDLTGFDNVEVGGLLDGSWAPPASETLKPAPPPEVEVIPPVEGEDDSPEPPAQPVTVAGDLWRLGDHLVLCGYSTQTDATSRLCAQGKAKLVFTDPPYNVDYEGYTEEKLKIQGDKMSGDQFSQFLRDVFSAMATTVIESDASLYVCHPSSWQREFQGAMEDAGFEVRTQIIWAKNTFAWGFGRYKFQHEPIFYAHLAGHSDEWYGDKSQSTLWHEKKPAANRLHPTMKPVELVERALVNSSKKGDVVFDGFGGSGSTLIACEKSGRQARLIELDPRYADVIVRRWQDFTKKAATLEGDGRTFDQVASARLPMAA